ncbi:MAG: GNAT family N-acetyltransferase [Anaerolineae bacterium]|jgi:RimJ/RimL family protein N-acetyltransferase|nr:GNAT family N-acetyltransferase [Anaerolineae bacterium]
MPGKTPVIRKATRIFGKTLVFRNAKLEDAPFILSLRIDSEKSRYLSPVTGALEDQQDWLRRYALSHDQAYFIIECKNEPIGTVRLYDPQGESFCWGSWILREGSPGHAAMESALMVYAYALDHLGFNAAHFDVRKGNERVCKFHERFGARKISETELDKIYEILKEDITASRQRYIRFLESKVDVEFL